MFTVKTTIYGWYNIIDHMNFTTFNEVFSSSEYFQFLRENGSPRKVKGLEKHHIYPRSFEDGVFERDNIVWLTLANHIRAHVLLVRSFESLDLVCNVDYSKALKAINIIFNTRWNRLSENQQENFISSIPEIADIRQKAMEQFLQEKLQKQQRQGISPNWGCTTKEARKKASETTLKRFGRKAGYFFTEEAIKHNRESRIQQYGSLTGMLHTEEVNRRRRDSCKSYYQKNYGVSSAFEVPEVRQRIKDVHRKKYGSCTGMMNVPEVRERNRQSHIERYGSMTGCMNTPEIIEKRKKIQAAHNTIRKIIYDSPRFILWYRDAKDNYKNRKLAVKDYMLKYSITWDNYLEFV